MEVQSKHWIVLTPEGDFIKVPRSDQTLTVGEEVAIKAAKRNRRTIVPAFVSVAAAAVLGMFFILPQMSVEQANAQTYIYVDVNPSLEIGIDEKRHIVELHPLNKSAEKLVDGQRWKNKNVDDFVIDFLENANRKGYVQKKDHVVLSGYKEEKNSQETLDKLKTVLSEQSKLKNMELTVHSLVMPKKVKDRASQFGLSPVKYAAWLIAKKEGKSLEVEQMEEVSLTELEPVSELLNEPEVLPELVEIIENEQSTDQPVQVTQPTGEPKPPATAPANQDEPVQEPQGEPQSGQDKQQPDQSDLNKKPNDPEGTNQMPPDNQSNSDTSQNTKTESDNLTTQEIK